MYKIFPLSLMSCNNRDYDVCERVKQLSVLQSQTYISKYGFSVDFLMQSNFFKQSYCISLNNI